MNTIDSIWCENILGNLSLQLVIIYSTKLTFFGADNDCGHIFPTIFWFIYFCTTCRLEFFLINNKHLGGILSERRGDLGVFFQS